MQQEKKTKKEYESPKVTEVKLEDKRGVGMAVGCKFERTDEACYQDQVTPLFDVSDAS